MPNKCLNLAVFADQSSVFQPHNMVTLNFLGTDGPFMPSEAPPTSYMAPKEPFEFLPVELNEIEPETVKDVIDDDAINDEYEQDSRHEEIESLEETDDNLDDMIIKSIEEALDIDVPVDAKLRHRDSSPRPSRNPELKSYPHAKVRHFLHLVSIFPWPRKLGRKNGRSVSKFSLPLLVFSHFSDLLSLKTSVVY